MAGFSPYGFPPPVLCRVTGSNRRSLNAFASHDAYGARLRTGSNRAGSKPHNLTHSRTSTGRVSTAEHVVTRRTQMLSGLDRAGSNRAYTVLLATLHSTLSDLDRTGFNRANTSPHAILHVPPHDATMSSHVPSQCHTPPPLCHLPSAML